MGRKATPEELAILNSATKQVEDKGDPDKAGALESYFLHTARGGGRVKSGAKRIMSLATDFATEEGRQERASIAESERLAEEELQSRTSEHPVASFLGDMTLPTIMSGGRAPLTAAARGAITGATTYNPSASGTALQTLLGGILGGGAQRIAQGMKLGPAAKEAGLRVMPEQTSPTFFGPKAMAGQPAFKAKALKTARFNQKQITKSALRDDLGMDTDVFVFPSKNVKGTLQQVDEKASRLFDDAIGSKENIILLNPRIKMIDDIASASKVATDVRNIQIDLAKRIKREIVKNKGVLPVSKYQEIRSDMTTSIIGLTRGAKKHAIGEMLDTLDDAAQGSLSTDTLSTFNQARRLWKNKVKYETLVKRNGIDPDTGLIDIKKFDSILNTKDAPAYIYSKNPSRTTQMMQVNKQIAGATDVKGSGQASGGLARVRFTDSGAGWIFDRFLGRPVSSSILKANRLPTDLATDIPPGLMPPLLNMSFGEAARERRAGEE